MKCFRRDANHFSIPEKILRILIFIKCFIIKEKGTAKDQAIIQFYEESLNQSVLSLKIIWGKFLTNYLTKQQKKFVMK